MIKNIFFILFVLLMISCTKPAIQKSPSIEDLKVDNESPMIKELQATIESENYKKSIYLINEGINTNIFFENGDTPLVLSIKNKSIFYKEDFSLGQELELKEFDKTLIEKGADVNLKSLDGYTPLEMALSRELDEISILIINYGIDWTYLDKDNLTYFEEALFYGRSIVLQYMVQFDDAIKSVINKVGLSQLFIYYWFDGIEEIIDTLISHGFKLETGYPLMEIALNENNYGAAKWLFDHGIKSHDPDYTILELAFNGRGNISSTYEEDHESYEKSLKNNDRIINLILEHLEGNEYRPRTKDEITQMFRIYVGSPLVANIPQSQWDSALLKYAPKTGK